MSSLLLPSDLYDYQREAVLHQLYHPESMLWLGVGLGKEQPISEPVLTPTGWVPIGDVQPNDFVIGAAGNPTEVLGVFPQGVKKVYRVEFSDGTFTKCGIDHLWKVSTDKRKTRIMSLKELMDAGLYRKAGDHMVAKWKIPMVAPVMFDKKNLPVEPYTLGVIMGKRSWEKCIPEEFLFSDVDDRLALLQGLLDTDGSPISKGGVEFSSTSEDLIDGVVYLTQSLGGVAQNKTSRVTTHQGGEGRQSWRVNVKLPAELTPFRLKRKLDKWVRPTKYQPIRKIKAIFDEGYSEESVCIRVAAPDQLYVTRNCVVTHNTPITLTTTVDRMRAGQVQKTLIIGPLRVIQAVWGREARKWEHTKGLRFSVIHGTPQQRVRALFRDADIYLINYENINWLAEQLTKYYLSQNKPLPFQMCVYDEITKMKNSTSMRVKGGKTDRKDKHGNSVSIHHIGWKKIAPHIPIKTGLTGSPAANGYIDLHGQFLVVDDGKRLGEYISHYRDSYFAPGFDGWTYKPTELGKQCIEQRISDITLKMDSNDYLDLPDCKTTNIMVDLPAKARKAYDELEQQLFTALDNGTEIELFNKQSLSNKVLQVCNGAIYNESGSSKYTELHDAKMDALEEVLEEAGGAPVLCSYTFTSDAERIMKRFKKYKPVNMTQEKSINTEKIINQWNDGKIKLMIGHPACLHPDTLVLTERNGWVKLIDVSVNDRVHDGVEFVSHSGCSYSGYKEVVDVFGITMTPKHKLLISDEWVEARNVDVSEEGEREAEFKWEDSNVGCSPLQSLRTGTNNSSSEYDQTQQDGVNSLPIMQVSSNDRDAHMENMEGDESQSEGCVGQKLRRTRNRYVRRMGGLYDLLLRHARRLSRRPNNRTEGCKQGILERELHMGDNVGPAVKQKKHTSSYVQRSTNALGRIMQSLRTKQDEVINETEQRDDTRGSCGRCDELTIREEYNTEERTTSRKEKVYDLVDCGPRNRFLVRNSEGKIFISKNSMGHGIDGLQESGCIIVWYGLNWSYELYEQFNGRINRNGQKRPVSLIRILCNNSIDLAVADAIEGKHYDQEGLKDSVQRYRSGSIDNQLIPDFM